MVQLRLPKYHRAVIARPALVCFNAILRAQMPLKFMTCPPKRNELELPTTQKVSFAACCTLKPKSRARSQQLLEISLPKASALARATSNADGIGALSLIK